jgi:hypothetical protein
MAEYEKIMLADPWMSYLVSGEFPLHNNMARMFGAIFAKSGRQ